eukprot:11169900-Lingulodinium_polyedra.AAC.1
MLRIQNNKLPHGSGASAPIRGGGGLPPASGRRIFGRPEGHTSKDGGGSRPGAGRWAPRHDAQSGAGVRPEVVGAAAGLLREGRRLGPVELRA